MLAVENRCVVSMLNNVTLAIFPLLMQLLQILLSVIVPLACFWESFKMWPMAWFQVFGGKLCLVSV